jgi:hypothetical protein
MLSRFVFAFLAFIGLILPATFALALWLRRTRNRHNRPDVIALWRAQPPALRPCRRG